MNLKKNFWNTSKSNRGCRKRLYCNFEIEPTKSETGYGYIKAKTNSNQNDYLEVEKFVEKPDLETTKKYLKEGNYF